MNPLLEAPISGEGFTEFALEPVTEGALATLRSGVGLDGSPEEALLSGVGLAPLPRLLAGGITSLRLVILGATDLLPSSPFAKVLVSSLEASIDPRRESVLLGVLLPFLAPYLLPFD